MIDTTNLDIVHHLLLYECGSTVNFNDTMLPNGLCDTIYSQVVHCTMNAASGWAVGGNLV